MERKDVFVYFTVSDTNQRCFVVCLLVRVSLIKGPNVCTSILFINRVCDWFYPWAFSLWQLGRKINDYCRQVWLFFANTLLMTHIALYYGLCTSTYDDVILFFLSSLLPFFFFLLSLSFTLSILFIVRSKVVCLFIRTWNKGFRPSRTLTRSFEDSLRHTHAL